MNKISFVFDVDGTLTPSRGAIDPEFALWFYNWAQDRSVYLVTGSDYAKTLEQVGKMIVEGITGVYNCAGSILTARGIELSRREFELTDDFVRFLEALLRQSPYIEKTGQHIEYRGALLNFSIVGRAADKQQRQAYYHWDLVEQERAKLARQIEQAFPQMEAAVAGETGIDIYPRGWDKSQIVSAVGDFVFFGDKTAPGGNDHSISLKAAKVHAVNSWQDTWQILKTLYAAS